MRANSNRELIAIVANGLGDLLSKVVFIGGAVTELYASAETEILEVRATDDVDCVIQLLNYSKFAAFEEELRSRKFINDPNKIMRWNYAGITVDVMPDDEKILGFSNPWYTEGIKNAVPYQLNENLNIAIFTLPYFLASKLTALFDRGMADLRLSKDLEDIVFCLFYCADFRIEIYKAGYAVRAFIIEGVNKLLLNPHIDEAIYCTLPSGEVNEENMELIIERLNRMKG